MNFDLDLSTSQKLLSQISWKSDFTCLRNLEHNQPIRKRVTTIPLPVYLAAVKKWFIVFWRIFTDNR